MRVVAKKLRDLIIKLSMKVSWNRGGMESNFYRRICSTDTDLDVCVRQNSFHSPSDCKSKSITSILVKDVLCLYRRTAPTAAQRYEFWLADENIARSVPACNASYASLCLLSNCRRYHDSLTGIYRFLTYLQCVDRRHTTCRDSEKSKNHLGLTSKTLIIHNCQRISKMVIINCYIRVRYSSFLNGIHEWKCNESVIKRKF